MAPKKSTRLQREGRVGKLSGPAAKEVSTPTMTEGKAKGPKLMAGKDTMSQGQAHSSSTEDSLLSLPPEILKLTLDNIRDIPTINALSRTCKRLYPLMMPRLYERIVVSATYHAHIPKLIRTLEPLLTIAQKKQLKKEGKYKGQQERHSKGLDEEARPICASYVRQMIVGRVDPGRKHKYIVDRYVEEAFKNLENLEIVETRVFTKAIGQSLASLKNPKTLRLFYSSGFDSEDMPSLARVKNLKHLEIIGYGCSGNLPEQSMLRNSTSTLQSLVIEGSSYAGNFFEKWDSKPTDGLYNFTALKSLYLSNMESDASVVKSLHRGFDFMGLRELTLKNYQDT